MPETTATQAVLDALFTSDDDDDDDHDDGHGHGHGHGGMSLPSAAAAGKRHRGDDPACTTRKRRRGLSSPDANRGHDGEAAHAVLPDALQGDASASDGEPPSPPQSPLPRASTWGVQRSGSVVAAGPAGADHKAAAPSTPTPEASRKPAPGATTRAGRNLARAAHKAQGEAADGLASEAADERALQEDMARAIAASLAAEPEDSDDEIVCTKVLESSVTCITIDSSPLKAGATGSSARPRSPAAPPGAVGATPRAANKKGRASRKAGPRGRSGATQPSPRPNRPDPAKPSGALASRSSRLGSQAAPSPSRAAQQQQLKDTVKDKERKRVGAEKKRRERKRQEQLLVKDLMKAEKEQARLERKRQEQLLIKDLLNNPSSSSATPSASRSKRVKASATSSSSGGTPALGAGGTSRSRGQLGQLAADRLGDGPQMGAPPAAPVSIYPEEWGAQSKPAGTNQYSFDRSWKTVVLSCDSPEHQHAANMLAETMPTHAVKTVERIEHRCR